jgi:hypothetical protein
MTTINLNLSPNANIDDALREARQAVSEDATVLSYFDRKENRSVPEVACVTKGVGGPRLIAEAQGAEYRVNVNGGEYELFLKSVPEGTVEPDASHEARLSIYDGRNQEEFQSFIGG